MGLVAANHMPDPRCVVTPLDPDRVEELLYKYDLFPTWKHIITRLHEGFDVGIWEHLSSSYIFRKPQIISVRPRLYYFIYIWRAGRRPLLAAIPSGRARTYHWPVLHISSRSDTKTSYGYLQNDSGHVVPVEQLGNHFRQPWYQLRRFPDSVGILRRSISLNLITPCRLHSCNFQHSAAYHLKPIRPDHQHHLCVLWKERVYVDRAVMFGLASSAGVFGRIADMLVAIYHKAGFTALLKWVDDFFVIRLPGQSWTEHEFMEVTGYFGVP